ncbi:hypothetical protein [Paracoccus sp. PAMC 22219]|uniref:hypothetical protein n=1 Tax=Paracoccus sp. PAMC 22219 TaxID=1569209 RepID=UPI0005A8F09F|nr:hypothetical protein [Paracoccus sp. PAMC 22219]
MADHCHNTPRISDEPLRRHCSDVQVAATQLCGVMQAIELLDDEGIGGNAVSTLIRIARSLAEKVNTDLDSVNLPKGGAA